MKNQWRMLTGFALVLLIVLFALFNNEPVAVNLLLVKITAPLILIILGSALIGVAIALLTSTTVARQQKKQIKQLEQRLQERSTVPAAEEPAEMTHAEDSVDGSENHQ